MAANYTKRDERRMALLENLARSDAARVMAASGAGPKCAARPSLCACGEPAKIEVTGWMKHDLWCERCLPVDAI